MKYSVLRAMLFFICLVFLAACSGHTEQAKRENPLGLSGKNNPKAEQAFAKAHVLWRDSEVCSNPSLAIELLDTAISLQGNYAAAYLRRGLAYSDLMLWDKAFDDLSQAIRLDPIADAYAYRGLVLMRSGNVIGARKDFEYSISLNASQYRAWKFRGALELLLDNIPNACSDLKKSCDNGDCTGYDSAKLEEICK